MPHRSTPLLRHLLPSELWIGLVRHGSLERHYEELLSDDHLTAWLICCMADHDTGFHDHGRSAGAVAVVSGRVREEGLALDGQPRGRQFADGTEQVAVARARRSDPPP